MQLLCFVSCFLCFGANGFISRTLSKKASRLASSKDPDSWKYLLSDRNRYAKTLNLTVDAMDRIIGEREEAVNLLQDTLEVTDEPMERHRLVVNHRYKHGKHPFVCRNCWLYKPICLCAEIQDHQTKYSIPCKRVIVWTHQDEWGSPTNTGSMLPLLLKECCIWMHGYNTKDLESAVEEYGVQPVVLWPENQITSNTRPSLFLSTLSSTDVQKIVLVVPEGTWRQSRRLVSKLPKHWPRASLSKSTVSQVLPESGISALSPLRCRYKAPANSVCTAEATVAALLSMGFDQDAGVGVLTWVNRKIEATRRYQGKRKIQ